MARRRLDFARGIRDSVRANFIAGMFIALPLCVTVAVLVWIWGQLQGPLRKVFGFTDTMGGPWDGIMEAFEGSRYEMLIPPVLGMCILLIAVLMLGILTRSIIGRFFLSIFEGLVARLPIVGMLYSSLKQLGEACVSEEGKSKFQSAVLVQFPMQGSWAIGFVTGHAFGPLAETMAGPLQEEARVRGEPPPDVVTVFVPTTPLPTQGFTLVLLKSETRELPISVEEAIKLVISGGIIVNPTASGKLIPQHLATPKPNASVAPGKSGAARNA